MSSQSTVEYYRGLDAGVNDARGGHHAADLAIRSVDFGRIEAFIREERWTAAGEFLAAAAGDLEAAGADVVLMATNTMHRVAPAIEAALSVPFVHIVDPTAAAVREAGLDTVGVLGTAPVMEGEFYADRFADHGVDVLVPDADDRALVDEVIFEELTRGEIRDRSRDAYLRVIDELAAAGAEGVVLGCTEIELLVDPADTDVPLFDTTALHVERGVEVALSGVDAAVDA
ncbi:aspartate/glutamate racemase family protein [Halobaculum lipolyticum]|uniref:Aspartate/glutamate racemase family protein n=1 Tax=Halobaculum lipolyticum TaxID=3032001 RepID=A0ABD5W9C2_9EURY